MVAHQEAIDLLEQRTGFKIVVAETVPPTQQPFTANSEIFRSSQERVQAQAVVQKYSSDVPERGTFGYAETQSLVAFFFNTPDNTLPIFWIERENWQPLFRYGADLASFKTEVIRGRGRARQKSEDSTPIRELDNLNDRDFSSEHAIIILEEFPYKALATLAPYVALLRIDASALKRALSIAKKLRHLVHEQKAVCTALFIVPSQSRDTVSTRCFASPNRPLLTTDESAVEALAELADGISAAWWRPPQETCSAVWRMVSKFCRKLCRRGWRVPLPLPKS